jgi:hypothetical protein
MPLTSNDTPITDPHVAYEMRQKCDVELLQHQLAANYFKARQFIIYTIPLGILTFASSIMSFLATSALVAKDQAKAAAGAEGEGEGGIAAALNPNSSSSMVPEILTLIVGCATAFSVFMQRLQEYHNYGQRAIMHETMVFNLNTLRNRLDLLKDKLECHVKAKYERDHDDDPDNDNDEFGWLDPSESYEAINKRKEEYLSACKSDIPCDISNAFANIKSQLCVEMKMDKSHGAHGTAVIQLFEKRAYDMLAMRIGSNRGFPLYIPNTKRIIANIINELHKDMEKYDSHAGGSGDNNTSFSMGVSGKAFPPEQALPMEKV